jgi:hypothetical protein
LQRGVSTPCGDSSLRRMYWWLRLLGVSGALGVYLLTAPGCACGDVFPEHVYRFSVFNPVRDRVPESVARAFLRDQGEGKCEPPGSDLCAYALKSHAVLGSRLVARQDTRTGVMLYYCVKTRDSGEAFWGQAAVAVGRQSNGWKVTSYNAVY